MMKLVVANLNYSSWSMRAWLALEHAAAEYRLFDVGMFAREGYEDRIRQFCAKEL
jgi:glutathione S-transferase